MVKNSKISEEEAAAKEKLCARYAPKCITGGCPLAKFYCYDEPNIVDLYKKGSPAVKRGITRILEQAIKEGV